MKKREKKVKKFYWINMCTGSINKYFIQSFFEIFHDMWYFPKCRTLEMFNIRKVNEPWTD